ncbi:hypothetical protein BaRGS_00008738 [Batillaria attramentaria]|uniref:C2H2-type domain-containing protein n=1 Tax=Batillaria attramentaria TaxID=370345 RepID=A0ABD0LLQ3_9CAEN
MPQKRPCPGEPNCLQVFMYARALKAHVLACRHAQKVRVSYNEASLGSMLTTVQHSENTELGNIRISRVGVDTYLKRNPVYDRTFLIKRIYNTRPVERHVTTPPKQKPDRDLEVWIRTRFSTTQRRHTISSGTA